MHLSLSLLALVAASIGVNQAKAFSPTLSALIPTNQQRRQQQQGPLFGLASSSLFSSKYKSTSRHSGLLLSLAKSHPEFSVVEEGGDEEDDVEPLMTVADTADDVSSSIKSSPSKSRMYNPHPYYTALSPGTVVQAQVGDVRLARKAWKKRRRSGSPLLVPCSVLAVDAKSALLWNVLYLLQKFGRASSNSSSKNKKNEITLTLPELLQRHNSHLKLNLKSFLATTTNNDNNNLGFDSVKDLMKDLLNDRVQESYGIKLVTPNDDDDDDEKEWYLTAPISQFRAQQRANQAAILQFSSDDATTISTNSESEKDDIDDSVAGKTFRHTGMVRNKRTDNKPTNDETSNTDNSNTNMYVLQPLSAALRVSRDDLDSGLVQNDSLHAAVVLEFDLLGDNGAPLLVLSLNPRRQVRDGLKINTVSTSNSGNVYTPLQASNNNNNNNKNRMIASMPTKYMMQDLHVGNGPMQAKVVRLIKGGALVDCGVGSKKSSSSSDDDDEDLVPVLGFLRFKDAVRLPASAASDGDDANEDDEDDNDLDEDVPDDAPWEDILSFDDLDDDVDDDDDEVDTDTSTTSRATTASSSSRKSRSDDMDLSALLLEDDEKEGGVIDTEDVTYLFEQNEDGSYTYTDPETGYSQVILNDDFDTDDDDDEDDDDDDDDEADSFSMERKNDLFISKPLPTATATTQRRRIATSTTTGTTGLQRKMLKVGELVDVYVFSASKQSHQLKVTMNPNDVIGKSARDLKKQEAVNKKLGRLAKQLGFKHDGATVSNGDENDESSFSLHRAMEYWKGREMNGIVKATSQTGDWLYVQPQPDEDDNNSSTSRDAGFLPVGVATIHVEKKNAGDNASATSTATAPSSFQEFRQGDPVRIRIQGIDKERGQLSFRVLQKLAP